MSQRSLCSVVNSLIVSGNSKEGTKGQWVLLSCSGQLKTRKMPKLWNYHRHRQCSKLPYGFLIPIVTLILIQPFQNSDEYPQRGVVPFMYCELWQQAELYLYLYVFNCHNKPFVYWSSIAASRVVPELYLLYMVFHILWTMAASWVVRGGAKPDTSPSPLTGGSQVLQIKNA